MVTAGSAGSALGGSGVEYVDGLYTALWVGVALSLVGAVAVVRLVGLGRDAVPAVAEAA